MSIRSAVVVALFLAQPLAAQTRSGQADLRDQWQQVSTYLLRSAQVVPDSSYKFKPTPAVRSFGELVAHVAGSQRMFCGAAMGAKPSGEGDIEKQNLSKADLVKALESSNAYCATAYATDPAKMTGDVELFGRKMSKGGTLITNAMHDDEHYGNMVTYMRIMGMVPPSSQPSM